MCDGSGEALAAVTGTVWPYTTSTPPTHLPAVAENGHNDIAWTHLAGSAHSSNQVYSSGAANKEACTSSWRG